MVKWLKLSTQCMMAIADRQAEESYELMGHIREKADQDYHIAS